MSTQVMTAQVINTTTVPQYTTVTEQPGQSASRLQLAMMAARYAWARSFAVGQDVLEVACGAGMGLGVLAEAAHSVEAGDIDPANLAVAQRTYAQHESIRIQHLDALELPYADASFDTVVLFEAIYYLPDAGRFLEEARRVLRPGGHLLLATVNREWAGFNPSPFHVRYFSARELRLALEAAGFSTSIQAGFPEGRGFGSALTGGLRHVAVVLGLVPRTMAGKAFLKRVFYGRMEPIPARLDLRRFLIAPFETVHASTDLTRYRVLYARAHKPSK